MTSTPGMASKALAGGATGLLRCVCIRVLRLDPHFFVPAVQHARSYPGLLSERMVTAHWLMIYPPNQTTPVYLKYTSPTCSKRVQILTLNVVQPGSGGSA